MKRGKVITFGEIMLRLSTIDYLKLEQSSNLKMSFAGSETNVAVSLSNLGMKTEFVTTIPRNNLGDAIIKTLRFHNVSTEHILRKNERLGIYYVESGFSQRPSQVIYDRKESGFSNSIFEEYNWKEIFEDSVWFHISGITPALSENLEVACLKALQYAKTNGITISMDLNYRNKLWSSEKASKVLKKYMQYVDVLIGNEEDAKIIFGYEFNSSESKVMNKDEYASILKSVYEDYSAKYIFFTLRESISANKNYWSSICFNGKEIISSTKYDIDIIDRLGAGDSFSAGVIFGLLNEKELNYVINFATAFSCLKHTVHGDFNLASILETEALMNGDSSGRIMR